MAKIDERHQALMSAYLSLDRRSVIIKNEGNSIALNVKITIHHSPEDPQLLQEDTLVKAEISYMPLSEIKLPTTHDSKGIYQVELSWSDSTTPEAKQTYQIFK